MRYKIILILIAIIFTSCQDSFEKIDNTPIGNYKLLFQYLKNDYAYKDNHSMTMGELENKYLPLIEKTSTFLKFENILIDIENYLQDPHFQPFLNAYNDTKRNPINYSMLKIQAHRDEIQPRLEGQIGIYSDNYFIYNILAEHKDIAYLSILELSSELNGLNKLKGNKWRENITNIVDDMNKRNISKLIMDIRTNAGGSNYNALYIANHFVDTNDIYMIEQYQNEKGSLSENIFRTTPTKKHKYKGKIILLTNNMTCSGGEMFVLAMKNKKGLIHIGTPTLGCSGSIISKDLYSGDNILMTSTQTTGKDGKKYFKTGIMPDLIIRNTNDTEEDKVIKKAIEILSKNPNLQTNTQP